MYTYIYDTSHEDRTEAYRLQQIGRVTCIYKEYLEEASGHENIGIG